MRSILCGWLALAVLVGAAGPCRAQSLPAYPTKPIRLIVPFEPGGTSEVLARLIGQKMSEYIGQRIVIDTRPGAAGSIGTALTATAPPDGYTLLFTSLSPIVINVNIYKGKLSYDPEKDLAPISVITKVPSVLTVHADFAQRTVKDMIAFAKANPGKLSYGSSGTGSVNHLMGELFKAAAGIDLLHVPYKGAGQGGDGSDVEGGQHGPGSAACRPPPYPKRQVQGSGRDQCKAVSRAARHADDQRVGAAGLRPDRLVLSDGVAGYAPSDHQYDPCGFDQDGHHAPRFGAPARGGGGARADYPRRARQADPRRSEELGQGGGNFRGEAGVTNGTYLITPISFMVLAQNSLLLSHSFWVSALFV